MANISYHASHNAAIVIEDKGEIIVVIEVERFLNSKNMGVCTYLSPTLIMGTLEEILQWVEKEYGIKEYDNCYFSNTDFSGEYFDRKSRIYNTLPLVPSKNNIHVDHHESHAYCTFYQSPYKKALVFSFDAGGDDGKFNIYLADREKGVERIGQLLNPIKNTPHEYYSLGFAYMIFGQYFKDIQLMDLTMGNLVYPGKIMGLASYGKVKKRWLKHFVDFYKSDPDGKASDYMSKLDILGKKIGVTFDINNRLSEQIQYDVAATSQAAFEECFMEAAFPYIDANSDLPICITGGCGLNILLNTKIKEITGMPVFVGPSPSDCGIAIGAMLKFLKPKKQIDLTYKGIPILDKHVLHQYLQYYPNIKKLMKKDEYYHPHEQYDPSIVINDLVEGKIVGVVRGNAEIGPRALGNRSILCNPSIEGMKDTLNAKVKNREWYRPFAPVVRLEDVEKYFEWEGESRFMSFCPKVRKKWRKKLQAITHVDNTARIQTVTKEQNEWLYDLLTELDKQTGVGVLLNTSFNVNGKPILSTYRDAFEIFDKTKLDCLLLEDYYIRKEVFKRI